MNQVLLRRAGIAVLYVLALYCAWFGFGATASKYDTITEVLARVSFDEHALPLIANIFLLRPLVAFLVTLFVAWTTTKVCDFVAKGQSDAV